VGGGAWPWFAREVYIVGMSLTTSTGSTVRLGYSSPSEYSVELSEIWGFRIALGSRGVKAHQCITGPTSSQCPWLGSPGDTPRTERLMARNRVAALETAFDVSVPMTSPV